MGESFRVFTVNSGKVFTGAEVQMLRLKGAGIEIPAVMIGEEGRGRERGVVPVDSPPMVPCPERNKDAWTSADRCVQCDAALSQKKEGSYTRHHLDQGQVRGRLMFAEVGETKTGKPKFFSKEKASVDDFIIVVFNTQIGFRGSNNHTGDRARVYWTVPGLFYESDPQHQYPSKKEAETARDAWYAEHPPTPSWVSEAKLNILFAEFPGKIIARGRIAQGDAGRAGGGEQLIALMPKNVVFRTAYSGRLYGTPSSHYYKWSGEKFLAATWDERSSADLF